MTVSMMVFICLVSFGGLGESFSAGGRPRLFLALEPPSSLPERSLSWRLLRLRFFSRISSSISSRFPSSIAWNNRNTDLIAITQNMQAETIYIAYKCYETTTITLHLTVQSKIWGITRFFKRSHLPHSEQVWIPPTAGIPKIPQHFSQGFSYLYSCFPETKKNISSTVNKMDLPGPTHLSWGECHIGFGVAE